MNNIDQLYEELTNIDTFFLIAGPCVIEDEHIMMRVAEHLKRLTSDRNIPFVFKSSFEKSNRTSIESYTGPGLTRGLKLLKKIKDQFTLPILTDIHETCEVDEVAEVADILQIPAFLCRQTPLMLKAAKTGKIINLKKGQFLAPEDMHKQMEKCISSGNFKVMLTERGSCFGYHNLIVDFRSFPLMKSENHPVVFDVTHSMQKPSLTKTTGGTPEFAPMMAQAAIATGFVNGLFIETHPNPVEALSDANTQLDLEKIEELLDKCLAVKRAIL